MAGGRYAEGQGQQCRVQARSGGRLCRNLLSRVFDISVVGVEWPVPALSVATACEQRVGREPNRLPADRPQLRGETIRSAAVTARCGTAGARLRLSTGSFHQGREHEGSVSVRGINEP